MSTNLALSGDLLSGNRAAGEGPLSSQERLLVVRGKSASPLPRRNVADRGLETVIGTDERTRILETTEPPWRQICALEIDGPAGSFVGTAWFAGPRTLITAGHCVFDALQMGGWATSIVVSPGRDGATRPFGSFKATRFNALHRWIEARDADYDIGCIHLNESPGERLGWFAIGAFEDSVLTYSLVNISGYPADLGNAEEQYFHANRILSAGKKRLFYDVDTFGGQSGSPAWIYRDGSDIPIVVGVHAYGVGATPAALGMKANSAPRVRDEVLETILEWLKEDGAAHV